MASVRVLVCNMPLWESTVCNSTPGIRPNEDGQYEQEAQEKGRGRHCWDHRPAIAIMIRETRQAIITIRAALRCR